MKNREDSSRLWTSDLPGLELFRAHLFHHAFPKHMHEDYTIGFNDGGQGCYFYRGSMWKPGAGSFNLINPGEIHTGQAHGEEGWAFRNLYISVSQVQHRLEQLEWSGRGFPYFREANVCHPALPLLFHRLFHALNTSASRLTQESLLLELLSQLFLHYADFSGTIPSPQSETKAIAQVQAYLEAHHAESISIDALAQLVGLSPYYLIRCFRQQVGLPPHGYQIHCQVMQAKRSLRTSRSLADIAITHGFYDQSHLTRHFKRVFGITPGQYQRAILSNTGESMDR